jgi:hypothetical protein
MLGSRAFDNRTLDPRCQGLVNEWQDTTTGDRGAHQSVEFLVSPNGELEMPWGDTLYSEVFGSIS